jgi:hypothetical protein
MNIESFASQTLEQLGAGIVKAHDKPGMQKAADQVRGLLPIYGVASPALHERLEARVAAQIIKHWDRCSRKLNSKY